jgi:hypothetical protein
MGSNQPENTAKRLDNVTYVLLGSALLLSTLAEYYAIMGLVAIFAGAPMAVASMGIVLGISKIALTSWLYKNWHVTKLTLRVYFTVAILVLMLLTSMGIFGFLSKAHSEHNVLNGDVMSQLALVEEQITIEKENIDANRKIIAQLDSQVNETISRTSSTDTTGVAINRSINIRRSQAADRKAAQEAILSAQGNIAKLNETKAPITAKVREVEAEVGPIKYIAAIIYGDQASDQSTLEAAVRWMILLIVAVFDPLAVLMFIAVNQDIARRKIEIVTDKKIESPDTLKTDQIEPVNNPVIESPDTLKTDQIGLPEDRIPPMPKIESVADKKIEIVTDNPVIEWERDRILLPTKNDTI